MNFSLNNSNKNEIKPIMELNRSNSYIKNSISITKKNTLEYDNIISKDISKNSQEIPYKFYESDLKNSTNLDKNENNNNIPSDNNTFDASYNKNIYNSKKSFYDETPITKLSKKKNSSILSNNEMKFPLNNNNNNNNNSFHLVKNKIPIHSKLITHYTNWKGQNYFPFKGHILEGPCSFRPTLMTACAMTIPTILFLVFNSKYLTDKLTIFVPILIGIIYLITFVYLIIASFCDPGIIRRFNLVNDNKNKDYINNNPMNIKRIEARIFQLGYIHNYKYCPTCGIMRPNRSTHCSDCNNCVERLDHHCPWIGNCAGKRNYIYFFIFLILLNILTILIIVFCIIYIVSKVHDYSDLNDELPEDQKIPHLTSHSFCDVIISLYLIIYCILTMCFITGLIFYHTRLVLINSTTKEELRHAFIHSYGNPYRKSICTNITNVLCPKTKKYSILDILRGDVKEICDINDNPLQNSLRKQEDENWNESIVKLNLETDLTNGLNDNLNYKENNSIDINNFKENIVMNNNPSNIYDNNQEEKSNNIDFYSHEKTLIKDTNRDEGNNIKKSYSFKRISNNSRLEEYLKYFGTGIDPNKKKKVNSEYISKIDFD